MFEVGRDISKIIKTRARADGQFRLRIVYAALAILFALSAMRTVYLGAIGLDVHRRGTGAAEWIAGRAPIVDRNGEILAMNVMSGHIVLRPHEVRDVEMIARTINYIMPNITIEDARAQAATGRRTMIRLRRFATYEQIALVRAARVPGLSVENIERRTYPQRRLFSHVVGFVGNDMTGLEGVERTANQFLSQNTSPLVLSLDARIQAAFYTELSRAKQRFSAIGAMGILMNARTGEIIAMVSLPDFDPENRSPTMANQLNLPMRGVFEMGSVFKIFTTAMAREYGIPMTREYDVTRPHRVLDFRGRTAATIRDHATFRPPRPQITVAEILHHSSNIGSAQIAMDMSADHMIEFFRRVKFDRALDLEFGRTERPLFHRTWGPTERATAAFGHGIAITPIHKLLAVNAMVNGGIWVEPTMHRRTVGEVRGTRIITPELSAELRGVLQGITETGSGQRARIHGINIGGKTSTAQKRRPDGTPDPRRNITSWAMTFPIESPQYTMLILLDEPRGTPETFGLRTAAWNAVPTAGRILDAILPILYN